MKIVHLGRRAWSDVDAAMRTHRDARDDDTEDELWLVEHDPVYTQGVAGRGEHLLAPGDIPVVRSDRGGQVTYHGPGQVVAYPLVDLRRLGLFVRDYVHRLEEALIATLADFGVTGHRVRGAPGIYVRLADPFGHAVLVPSTTDPFAGLAKIAALGVKVSRHRTTHGVALNVEMDLTPFAGIDPCGYRGLRTVDLAQLGVTVAFEDVAQRLAGELARRLLT